MTELERLNEALKEAFAKIGITKKTDMAAYIPYRFSYFSEVTTGHKPMSRLFLNKLYERIGINPQWVRTGEGEMLTEPAVPKAENGSRRQSTRAAKSDMQEVQALFEELKKQLAEKDEQLSKRDAQIDRLLQIIENLSSKRTDDQPNNK